MSGWKGGRVEEKDGRGTGEKGEEWERKENETRRTGLGQWEDEQRIVRNNAGQEHRGDHAALSNHSCIHSFN